ncbi:sugar ABC transporter substrate-binding protein [Shimia thalassica]|jgi:sorbitol/mannitol transport system substrate-binding protein|uniref:Putative ABC transporter-binding protein n=1 Tax=Shimia thalassica TaxID=1715693 RepID=A0A0P1IGN0_9RHOB|nr:sugar ABC transporter substrate-binding protein [Shimia thalassica]MDO6481065.1 sugar ABC transporter substrate-binding protein [Shimia thalassica]MDO6485597.1 sugar ABC transporter substrate-binding protein [Shimia thalassica]MDO6523694.1 sugar ABC transporter substrate-binding protein [Shimia thalassica]MDO6800090.1 sugar ABC transporter substrate-binding protein [Shimia thalassica]MDP2496091.1 sugar ABC transporter substrate-binding protein [Shimia thalassica]
MSLKKTLYAASAFALLAGASYSETTVTIATVNNGDMIRMQGLTDDFTAQNPDIKLEWVTLEENVLRQRVTQDIAAKGGQFDVMTIGTYEVPIWGKQGWLVSLNDLPDAWDADDLLPAIRGGLTVDGELYAAPFYGESSMVMYRKDLMAAAGMEMPEAPTWDEIKAAAAAMTDKEGEVYGICLRGKAGWGENMAFLTAMSNSFGARWFDENWKPELNGAEWTATVNYYMDLMNNYGPPGASTNGFNENLSLFQQGKCGMWIDATVAASFVTNPKDSTVADQVGFALAPDNGMGKRGNWLWAWSLGIPAGSDATDAAKKFVAWATSKEYTALVASKEGWANVPPGTRTSLYENAEYAKVPFAAMTLGSINAADPTAPSVKPVPYTGVQFVAIPEFAGIATQVGQEISAALAGQQTVEQALDKAQMLTSEEMEAAGY